MKILGIETSCDETAISILEISGDEKKPDFCAIGNSVLSQIKIHAEYGGVFPNLAKREHSKNLVPILKETLNKAGLIEESKKQSEIPENLQKFLEREPELFKHFSEFIPKIEKPKIDAIAVTQGPGLEPALWVGINFAKALNMTWNIPIIPVNHMEGHLVSALLHKESLNKAQKLHLMQFPALALLISGGHTEIVLAEDFSKYKIVGKTKDDAIGEAYDKVARMLGLPYPGGPEISKLAEEERQKNNIERPFVLPRPMIHSKDLDFSFAGLKTAVLYTIKKLPKITEEIKKQIAKEFEDAVTEVLVTKMKKAIDENAVKTVLVGGGVIANKFIRKSLEEMIKKYEDINILIPDKEITTDNALMIALAGYFAIKQERKIGGLDFRAEGNLSL